MKSFSGLGARGSGLAGQQPAFWPSVLDFASTASRAPSPDLAYQHQYRLRHTDAMSILRWLGLADAGDDHAPVDSLREIEKALTHMEPAQARYLAGFAYILGRVAKADHQVTSEESAAMERMVAERGSLPAD